MSETPTLRQVLDATARVHLFNTNICLPGIIRKYNAEDRKADIQPVIKLPTEDGFEEPIPIIIDVPIQMPGGNRCSISLPLRTGDLVLLVFSQASLDRWLESAKGELVDPKDGRRNDLTDAVAIPGLYPFSLSPNKSLTNADKDVIIVNNIGESTETLIALTGTGEVLVGDNNPSNPLLKPIARLGDTVSVTVIGGSSSGVHSGTITSGSPKNKST